MAMNQQKLMKQMQKMQEDMARAQEQLAQETVSASAGGGAATVTGAMEVVSVEISPDAVDPEDVEMLQDVIVAAVNEAMRAAQELANQRMGAVTGGLSGLGLPGF
ncbi:MAG: YbaB/EbfC family nucleoid-associated protein [Miltoncostaeaceae bacterium]